MTHLYDTEEPGVISQQLLRKAVLQQGPEGEAGRLAQEEGIAFSVVRSLRLDFQNILHIENLWQFSSLRKLQLDNNIIEKIEGLEALVHLEWLDLSFNNISEVGEGLKQLTKLRDLGLAHNQLTDIAGFDSLSQLQSLSLASNKLTHLNQVSQLRPLSSLQSLTLSGNPLTSDPSYQQFTLAFLPSLIYLDFSMIFPEEREAVSGMFSEALAEVELAEREARRRREEREEERQLQETYQAAYVDGLQGTALFDSMFEEDGDAERIALLPGVADMLTRMKEEFVLCVEHLTKVGLEEGRKREEEVASFHRSHQQAISQSQQRSVDIVSAFESKLVPGANSQLMSSVEHDLTREEMTLVEQLDEIIKDFERNYSDMVTSFLETVQSHMTQLRELENSHHEKVTELALQYLESTIKGSVEEEPPEQLRKLLTDKDTLVSALNTSHDGHLLAIDSREDSISHRAKADLSRLLEALTEAELARNRRKITEVKEFLAWHRREAETSA